MTTQEPPIRNPLTEKEGELTLPWVLFFNQVFNGDAGTSWTPTFTGLTTVGAPTITGRYYQISQYLCYFNILITPATNTSSTAGATYVDNFPLQPSANGFCLVVGNNLGGAIGEFVSANNRIYTPSWTTVTTAINVIGFVEAS